MIFSRKKPRILMLLWKTLWRPLQMVMASIEIIELKASQQLVPHRCQFVKRLIYWIDCTSDWLIYCDILYLNVFVLYLYVFICIHMYLSPIYFMYSIYMCGLDWSSILLTVFRRTFVKVFTSWNILNIDIDSCIYDMSLSTIMYKPWQFQILCSGQSFWFRPL